MGKKSTSKKASKKKTKKRTTLPEGFKAKEYKALKEEVRRYNGRIRYARKGKSEDILQYLPSTVSVNELAKLGPNKAKEIASQLKTYTKKNLELTVYDGQILTKADVAIIKKNIDIENLRRAEIKKMTQQAETAGRFISQEDVDLRPIEGLTPYRIKNLLKLDYEPQIDRRTVQYQMNYLNTLKSNYEDYKFYIGSRLDEHFSNIIRIVETLEPAEFYVAQATIPNVDIAITSDVVRFAHNIEAIEAAWQSFYESRGYA